MNLSQHLLSVMRDAGGPHVRSGAEGIHASASEAGQCVRQIAYNKMVPNGTQQPTTLSQEVAFEIGRDLHEMVQEALKRQFPSFQKEAVWVLPKLSGRADGVYTDGDGNGVAVEIKTIALTGFRYASDKGPRREHILQCGLSAMALGCTKIHLIYLCKNCGREEDPLREWVMDYPKAQVDAAVIEMTMAVDHAVGGMVPARWWNGDYIDVPSDKHPVCRWCGFFERCQKDGPGRVKYNGRAF